MKLVSYEASGKPCLGVLSRDGSNVINLTAAGVAADLNEFVLRGSESRAAALKLLQEDTEGLPFAGLHLLAPIARPRRNIICVGKNYLDHANEFQKSGFDATSNAAVPEFPIIFTKAPSSVIGPGDAIPASSDPENTVDYEGELAVIIGKGGHGLTPENAFEHVFGYTILNDVTSRGLQKRHLQWFLGKSIDGFCPMGPYVVTADEIPDIRECTLITHVNGEIRQEAKINQLIFDIPTLLTTISKYVSLEPGDIIATGTPAGVGIGFDPPKFLKSGDVVEVRIDGLGELTNPVR